MICIETHRALIEDLSLFVLRSRLICRFDVSEFLGMPPFTRVHRHFLSNFSEENTIFLVVNHEKPPCPSSK